MPPTVTVRAGAFAYDVTTGSVLLVLMEVPFGECEVNN